MFQYLAEKKDTFDPLSADDVGDSEEELAAVYKKMSGKLPSTGKLVTAGATRGTYSAVVAYESDAKTFGNDWVMVRSEYTVLNDHPVFVLDGKNKQAAEQFVNLLKTRNVQKKMAEMTNLRPAVPNTGAKLSDFMKVDVDDVDLPTERHAMDELLTIAK